LKAYLIEKDRVCRILFCVVYISHSKCREWRSGGFTMNLSKYFENIKGRGILSTADADGLVDAAVYGRPHVIDETTIAFIMRDRLTHANLQSNPHAVYLFMEEGSGGYRGIRLYLTKISEEQDTERLYALRRPDHNAIKETREERAALFLVFFRVDKTRPLTETARHAEKAA
jgi:hypothetical protein